MARKLKYRGKGAPPGVPASDHTCGDDALAKQLVDRKLFSYASKGDADDTEAPEPEAETEPEDTAPPAATVGQEVSDG